MYLQNLMVRLQVYGIASCPQTILGYNARVVREQLNIVINQKLLFGISFDYEDLSSPANQVQLTRVSLTEFVRVYD